MPAAPDYFSVCVVAACTYYSTVGNGLHSYVHGVCMCIVCRCLCVRACVRACVCVVYVCAYECRWVLWVGVCEGYMCTCVGVSGCMSLYCMCIPERCTCGPCLLCVCV